MQDRNVKLLPQVVLNLALESVEHRVAKRAGRHHRLRAAVLRRQDVLAGQLDRDLFVMRGGMEAAAFRPAAVIDGAAAQNFSKSLKRDVIARVDEAVSQRRTGDVASVECRHRQVRSGDW